MVVGIRDAAKLTGISIIVCCAVLVCAMFTNYYLDITAMENQITSDAARIMYDAQVATAKVVCMVSGGCLLATSVVMLVFYIRNYIDTHKKELGILKALGYSNFAVAKHFLVFGLSALIGAALGMCGAFALMPTFYDLQNEYKLLPELAVGFHWSLLLGYVALPAVGFGLLAVAYAWLRLRMPVLSLLREQERPSGPKKQNCSGPSDRPFLTDLRSSTLRSRKTLVFFILFAAFCFSAMTQMSTSMKELSSEMMGVMMLIIGLALAFTTLFLAVTTVVRGNARTIALMKAFGYSDRDCGRAILGGYRPFAYLGFALGTGYQYGLLRLMVDLVFADVEGVPEYRFDVPVMLICLTLFAVTYEAVLWAYARRMRRITLKSVMLDT